MKHTKQPQNSVKDISRRMFARGLVVGLSSVIAFVVLTGGLQYGQADGQAEDALFIDQDGTVKMKRLDVEGNVSSQDLKASGTVDAKKYVGDGSDLKVKTEMGEKTLKDAMALIKQDLDKCMSKPSGFFNFHSAWITSLGQYGPAVIDVKKGDIVKVDLIGSASESEFYYSIVETTGQAEMIGASTQVIRNQNYWRSITTTGLFRAQADTRLWFRAKFAKGDVSGRVKVFGLTLIATVVGSVTHKMNVALQAGGAKALQSTTSGHQRPAGLAIDGNTNGDWKGGSVTHTKDEPDSWWQVELPLPAKIEEIVIWNRSDCCGDRLSNFRVSVLDDPSEPVWYQDFAGPVAQGGFEIFRPEAPVKGRYVKVQIQGKNKEGNGCLSLAEVEVFGELTMNLALQAGGAKASESSTRHSGADRAIDGNTDGNFRNGSVTHTQPEPDSWWQVELPSPAIIEEIVIWNRSDCCGIRLSNFRVSVLDDPSKPPVWYKDFKKSVAQGGSEVFKPDGPVRGRFVKVQIIGKNLEGNGILSLAEVQVFGEFTK